MRRKGMTADMNRVLYADDCLNALNGPDKLPDDSVYLIYSVMPCISGCKARGGAQLLVVQCGH